MALVQAGRSVSVSFAVQNVDHRLLVASSELLSVVTVPSLFLLAERYGGSTSPDSPAGWLAAAWLTAGCLAFEVC